MRELSESAIEKRLATKGKAAGLKIIKLMGLAESGFPDRLILASGGRAYFAELKRPGKVPRPLQVVRIKSLRALGFTVFVIDSFTQVDNAINKIRAETVSASRD